MRQDDGHDHLHDVWGCGYLGSIHYVFHHYLYPHTEECDEIINGSPARGGARVTTIDSSQVARDEDTWRKFSAFWREEWADAVAMLEAVLSGEDYFAADTGVGDTSALAVGGHGAAGFLSALRIETD